MKGLVDYSSSDDSDSDNENEVSASNAAGASAPKRAARRDTRSSNTAVGKGAPRKARSAPSPSKTTGAQEDKLKAIATRSPQKQTSREAPTLSPAKDAVAPGSLARGGEQSKKDLPPRPFSLNFDADSLRELNEERKRAMSGELVVVTKPPDPSPRRDGATPRGGAALVSKKPREGSEEPSSAKEKNSREADSGPPRARAKVPLANQASQAGRRSSSSSSSVRRPSSSSSVRPQEGDAESRSGRRGPSGGAAAGGADPKSEVAQSSDVNRIRSARKHRNGSVEISGARARSRSPDDTPARSGKASRSRSREDTPSRSGKASRSRSPPSRSKKASRSRSLERPPKRSKKASRSRSRDDTPKRSGMASRSRSPPSHSGKASRSRSREDTPKGSKSNKVESASRQHERGRTRGSTTKKTEHCQVIEIESRVVGIVIGIAGKNIKQLMHDSNAFIHVPEARERQHGVPTPVTIRGSREAIRKAKVLINELLESRLQGNDPRDRHRHQDRHQDRQQRDPAESAESPQGSASFRKRGRGHNPAFSPVGSPRGSDAGHGPQFFPEANSSSHSERAPDRNFPERSQLHGRVVDLDFRRFGRGRGGRGRGRGGRGRPVVREEYPVGGRQGHGHGRPSGHADGRAGRYDSRDVSPPYDSRRRTNSRHSASRSPVRGQSISDSHRMNVKSRDASRSTSRERDRDRKRRKTSSSRSPERDYRSHERDRERDRDRPAKVSVPPPRRSGLDTLRISGAREPSESPPPRAVSASRTPTPLARRRKKDSIDIDLKSGRKLRQKLTPRGRPEGGDSLQKLSIDAVRRSSSESQPRWSWTYKLNEKGEKLDGKGDRSFVKLYFPAGTYAEGNFRRAAPSNAIVDVAEFVAPPPTSSSSTTPRGSGKKGDKAHHKREKAKSSSSSSHRRRRGSAGHRSKKRSRSKSKSKSKSRSSKSKKSKKRKSSEEDNDASEEGELSSDDQVESDESDSSAAGSEDGEISASDSESGMESSGKSHKKRKLSRSSSKHSTSSHTPKAPKSSPPGASADASKPSSSSSSSRRRSTRHRRRSASSSSSHRHHRHRSSSSSKRHGKDEGDDGRDDDDNDEADKPSERKSKSTKVTHSEPKHRKSSSRSSRGKSPLKDGDDSKDRSHANSSQKSSHGGSTKRHHSKKSKAYSRRASSRDRSRSPSHSDSDSDASRPSGSSHKSTSSGKRLSRSSRNHSDVDSPRTVTVKDGRLSSRAQKSEQSIQPTNSLSPARNPRRSGVATDNVKPVSRRSTSANSKAPHKLRNVPGASPDSTPSMALRITVGSSGRTVDRQRRRAPTSAAIGVDGDDAKATPFGGNDPEQSVGGGAASTNVGSDKSSSKGVQNDSSEGTTPEKVAIQRKRTKTDPSSRQPPSRSPSLSPNSLLVQPNPRLIFVSGSDKSVSEFPSQLSPNSSPNRSPAKDSMIDSTARLTTDALESHTRSLSAENLNDNSRGSRSPSIVSELSFNSFVGEEHPIQHIETPHVVADVQKDGDVVQAASTSPSLSPSSRISEAAHFDKKPMSPVLVTPAVSDSVESPAVNKSGVVESGKQQSVEVTTLSQDNIVSSVVSDSSAIEAIPTGDSAVGVAPAPRSTGLGIGEMFMRAKPDDNVDSDKEANVAASDAASGVAAKPPLVPTPLMTPSIVRRKVNAAARRAAAANKRKWSAPVPRKALAPIAGEEDVQQSEPAPLAIETSPTLSEKLLGRDTPDLVHKPGHLADYDWEDSAAERAASVAEAIASESMASPNSESTAEEPPRKKARASPPRELGVERSDTTYVMGKSGDDAARSLSPKNDVSSGSAPGSRKRPRGPDKIDPSVSLPSASVGVVGPPPLPPPPSKKAKVAESSPPPKPATPAATTPAAAATSIPPSLPFTAPPPSSTSAVSPSSSSVPKSRQEPVRSHSPPPTVAASPTYEDVPPPAVDEELQSRAIEAKARRSAPQTPPPSGYVGEEPNSHVDGLESTVSQTPARVDKDVNSRASDSKEALSQPPVGLSMETGSHVGECEKSKVLAKASSPLAREQDTVREKSGAPAIKDPGSRSHEEQEPAVEVSPSVEKASSEEQSPMPTPDSVVKPLPLGEKPLGVSDEERVLGTDEGEIDDHLKYGAPYYSVIDPASTVDEQKAHNDWRRSCYTVDGNAHKLTEPDKVFTESEFAPLKGKTKKEVWQMYWIVEARRFMYRSFEICVTEADAEIVMPWIQKQMKTYWERFPTTEKEWATGTPQLQYAKHWRTHTLPYWLLYKSASAGVDLRNIRKLVRNDILCNWERVNPPRYLRDEAEFAAPPFRASSGMTPPHGGKAVGEVDEERQSATISVTAATAASTDTTSATSPAVAATMSPSASTSAATHVMPAGIQLPPAAAAAVSSSGPSALSTLPQTAHGSSENTASNLQKTTAFAQSQSQAQTATAPHFADQVVTQSVASTMSTTFGASQQTPQHQQPQHVFPSPQQPPTSHAALATPAQPQQPSGTSARNALEQHMMTQATHPTPQQQAQGAANMYASSPEQRMGKFLPSMMHPPQSSSYGAGSGQSYAMQQQQPAYGQAPFQQFPPQQQQPPSHFPPPHQQPPSQFPPAYAYSTQQQGAYQPQGAQPYFAQQQQQQLQPSMQMPNTAATPPPGADYRYGAHQMVQAQHPQPSQAQTALHPGKFLPAMAGGGGGVVPPVNPQATPPPSGGSVSSSLGRSPTPSHAHSHHGQRSPSSSSRRSHKRRSHHGAGGGGLSHSAKKKRLAATAANASAVSSRVSSSRSSSGKGKLSKLSKERRERHFVKAKGAINDFIKIDVMKLELEGLTDELKEDAKNHVLLKIYNKFKERCKDKDQPLNVNEFYESRKSKIVKLIKDRAEMKIRQAMAAA